MVTNTAAIPPIMIWSIMPPVPGSMYAFALEKDKKLKAIDK